MGEQFWVPDSVEEEKRIKNWDYEQNWDRVHDAIWKIKHGWGTGVKCQCMNEDDMKTMKEIFDKIDPEHEIPVYFTWYAPK